MVVMVLQKNPAALKGELSRWLFEVSPGLYIGHVSAMVRDRLWEKCANNKRAGSVFQAWSTNTEQHFAMRVTGSEKLRIVDYEGLQFVEEVGNVLTVVQMKRMKKG